MDPSYSVLVTDIPDGCSSNEEGGKKNRVDNLIYIIVFSIVGGIALLAVIAYFAYPKLRLRRKLQKQKILEMDSFGGSPGHRPVERVPSSPKNSMNIEMTPNMEIHTAAGHFVVQSQI